MVGAPLNSSTSPSDSGTSACEQRSSTAYRLPSKSTTAMSMSASSTRSDPFCGTSARAQTRSNAISGDLDGLVVQTGQRAQPRLDGAHEAVLQVGQADQ